VIQPDDVLGPPRQGACLAHIGDVGQTEGLSEYVQGADLLVIEATYLEHEAELARQFGHLTAAQAAKLASDAGVHQLVLTHISRRYREADILDEARSVFPSALVARDFDQFQVFRDRVEHVTGH
jgi:ribonuclease Z